MRWFACAVCAGAFVFACGSSSSSSDSGPAAGDERGACYPNGTCNAGLTCLSNLCVKDASAPPPNAPPPNAPPPPAPPPPPADGGSDTGVDAGPTLSGDVQPIYTQHCAVSGCHTGAMPVANLDLTSGKSFAATVNVDSAQKAGSKIVLPSDAEASYLYLKITGRQEPGTSVQPPITTGDVLSQKEKDTVRDWINAGAKND